MKKTIGWTIAGLAGIGLIINTGCTTVHKARSVETVDASPGAADKGYAEFYAVSDDAVVPVYIIDKDAKPHLLGSVGVKSGSRYCERKHPGVVAQRLRVALPPGDHLFMIQNNGPRLSVGVQSGQTTPVELNYHVLENADAFTIYRLDTHAFPAAESQPATQEKSKS